MTRADVAFQCMGTDMRLVVDGAAAADAVADAEAWLRLADARLSRFRPDSELCAFNADPRPAVPASKLLRAAIGAAVWAAERTDGLVDPTLLPALRAVGYTRSLAGCAPAPLEQALAVAPPRAPAAPHPVAAWRDVDAREGDPLVRRPPGVEIDTGGTGKGLAADAVAHLLATHERFAVDCGGDLRVGGPGARIEPFEIEVEHPLTGEAAEVLRLSGGAVATSGIGARLWRRADGSFAHHLLDPSTGEPAWTGLLAVTALADTALEAETLAKAALLSGPAGARRLLGAQGGVLVHDDGDVEKVGPVPVRHVVRILVS
jgi:thiamine biosynthesis lipoprotein